MLAPGHACASAWRAPPEGNQIVSTVYGVRDDTALSESSAYVESQLWRDWDGVITVQVDAHEGYSEPDEYGVSAPQTTWRAEATAALKTTLVEGKGYVLSGSGGLTYAEGSADRCGFGAEARLMAGFSYGAWFSDVAGGYRALGGCRSGKIDVTAGRKLGESWLGLGQTFIDVSSDRDPVIKLQFSAVRYGDRGEGVQVGVRFRADEAGAGERALVVGWWKALTKAYQPRID